MSYYRLVDVARQFFDDNGDPLSGGKLYTYSAGTTSNKATYQDNAGVTAHANPIVLDSAGRVPAEVWGTTGGYKLKLDTSGDVNVWTRDNVEGVNDTAAAAVTEWVTSSLTPTYSSATQFTFSGDQTDTFHVGRRLKITDSGGTDYGIITGSSYSDPTTTIDVVLDSGSIDSGISSVSYGIVSFTSGAIRQGMVLLASGTASSVSSIDIEGTDYLSDSFDTYVLRIWNCGVAATASMLMRVKVSSYQTANYAWITHFTTSAATATIGLNAANSTTVAADGLYISAGQTNGTNDRGAWTVTIENPSATGKLKPISWQGGYGQSAGATALMGNGFGWYAGGTGAITGIRILASTGNCSLSWALYGVNS